MTEYARARYTPGPTVRIDMPTKNPLNGSQGRTRAGMLARAAKRKHLRLRTAWQCRWQCGSADPWLIHRSFRITITRISPRPLNEWDGLRAALKPVVDGIADFLATKDEDKRCTWNYAQRRGRVRESAIEILFEGDLKL